MPKMLNNLNRILLLNKMCDIKNNTKNQIVDIVGYCGGVILSIFLVPQIYKIIKTKEVENISYLWQFLYITGIILHLYYSSYYNILPILIPTIIELFFICVLFSLKLIYKKK